MYGIMSRKKPPKKTTIYLPPELKEQVTRIADAEQVPEAYIIREAIDQAVAQRAKPRPRIPLGNFRLSRPDVAERANELLDGFGE